MSQSSLNRQRNPHSNKGLRGISIKANSNRNLHNFLAALSNHLRKTAFTAMAGQTDLKTLMEFSGHTQVSTVIGNYVFATSESIKSAVNGMDQLRPRNLS